jgi:ribosome biogenesis GTPase
MQARIKKSSRRSFDCLLPNGDVLEEITALGNLLKNGEIVVGDYVELTKDLQGEWFIESLTPRKNSIYRRIIRERAIKTLASNIDLLVIVTSVTKPEFKRGIVDRYLLRSIQWDLPALIVFNKMDQFSDQIDLEFETKRLETIGVSTICTSAMQDISELKNILKDQTSLFVGQSGVGKSKLISALSNGKVSLRSEKLAKVGKGAHTTSWSELIHFDNIEIIDSPGVRTMSIEDISITELEDLFPDLYLDFGKCKYRDCKHLEQSKGCYFNSLDQSIIENRYKLSRLESFIRFKVELLKIPEWEK